MKKFNRKQLLQITFLLFALLSAGFFSNECQAGETERQHVLKIYNWADYIDENLLTEFPKWYKEQTGEEVKIVYQVFDMTEVMYTKIDLGKEDFDLACPTQAVMQRMLNKDLLLPIERDFGMTPNYLNNMSPFIVDRLDDFSIGGKNAANYAVPYMWGVSGILYNTQKVSADEMSSWGCFWNPKNKGKMLMKDSYWDVYAMAAVYGYRDEIASGKRSLYSVTNDHTPDDIHLVENEIKSMKPYLAGWEADFGKDMMTKGEKWFCYAWNGDAVWAIDEASNVGVSLDFAVPKEGSNVWFDCWVIPKYAQNTKAASYFLDYLCRSDIALRNMDVSGYCSAVASSEILDAVVDSTLDKTVNLSYFFGPGHDNMKVNPVQYPDQSVVDRCAIINDFLDKNDEVLEMWSRAKGDNLFSGMTFLIIGVVVLLAAWIIFTFVKKSKSKKRRLGKKK
ncbi:MAG TPA: ABC transporter substrate-binding protein [Prolixibacteraceae bacterium]|nr:ABC transporter substrate-binding protein [Prolixibacteraceae bacterium]HPS11901.1 ABC transporter substrate-binding protein [Prolixibacteraceae bacterium]